MLLDRRYDREHHVAGRTDVQRGVVCGQAIDQLGVVDGSDAVLDAIGAEQVEGFLNGVCSGEFAGVGYGQQPGRANNLERLREQMGRCSGFVSVKAEADDSVAAD